MHTPRPVGDIITINEGAVSYTADNLRELLESTDPWHLLSGHNQTIDRTVVALDDNPEGLYLRWTKSRPADDDPVGWGKTAAMGEPPIRIEDTITHVRLHEREMANLTAIAPDITIPQHSVFIVESDPYHRWPVVYSVVENIQGSPLLESAGRFRGWMNKLGRANPEKLLKLGKGLVDYYSRAALGNTVLHSDTAKPEQYSENLKLYDIAPLLATDARLGILAVRNWSRFMRNSQERTELRTYIKEKLSK